MDNKTIMRVVEILLDDNYDNDYKKSLIGVELDIDMPDAEAGEEYPIGTVYVRRSDLGKPNWPEGAEWNLEGRQGKKGSRWRRVA